MSVTEFAKRVNYSRRNIYSIFDKESVDTATLKKIGDVLEQDFFLDYSIGGKKQAHYQSNLAEPLPSYGESKIRELLKEIEYLKEINALLKTQVEKLSMKKKK